MNSELFHNYGSILFYSNPDLIAAGKRKIAEETLGHVDDPLPSSSDVKTPGSPFFHSCEIYRMLIINGNFIRNHKINIRLISYSFIRKVMKWRIK